MKGYGTLLNRFLDTWFSEFVSNNIFIYFLISMLGSDNYYSIVEYLTLNLILDFLFSRLTSSSSNL